MAWRILLAALFALIAFSAHAQNVLFPANPGDMIVKGTVGTWTAVSGGTAGCMLRSNGPTAAPMWSCALPLNFALPPMAPNTVWGNITAAQAPGAQITATQFLDTIDYDIQRTPLNGSTLTKAGGIWRAIPPVATAGWVWTNQGTGLSPQWGPPGAFAGIVPPAQGGFGVNIAALSGVPLFSVGVPTFTPTTGTGNFARVTNTALAGATLSGSTLLPTGSAFTASSDRMVFQSAGSGQFLFDIISVGFWNSAMRWQSELDDNNIYQAAVINCGWDDPVLATARSDCDHVFYDKAFNVTLCAAFNASDVLPGFRPCSALLYSNGTPSHPWSVTYAGTVGATSISVGAMEMVASATTFNALKFYGANPFIISNDGNLAHIGNGLQGTALVTVTGAGAVSFNTYTTAGAIVNDASGNLTSVVGLTTTVAVSCGTLTFTQGVLTNKGTC